MLSFQVNFSISNIFFHHISEIGGFDFAGSRGSGVSIREKIKPILNRGENVTLDLVGVENITQSFADEVLGIFVRAFGVDYIKGESKTCERQSRYKRYLQFCYKLLKKEECLKKLLIFIFQVCTKLNGGVSF